MPSWSVPVALSLLLLGAFFSLPYLPMVDLPQHAAQISAWIRLDDAASVEAHRFSLNLRTPYLTAYILARIAGGLVGVVPGLKLVVWLSVVAHWAAFAVLVRKLGHPSWLSLLGIPLGIGYGFFYGFISYIAAVPLVLLALSAALTHRERPSLRHGVLFGALLCLTLVTHGFAFALVVLMVTPLLLRGGGSLGARFAPFLPPAVLGVAWLGPGPAGQAIGTTIWSPRLRELLDLPALFFASSAADHAAWALGVVVLVVTVLAMGEPARTIERWVPLALLIVGFCLFPLSLRGFGPWHPRFATLVIPALLLAFEPRREPRLSQLPLLTAALCVGWFGLFSVRLVSFSKETRAFSAFVDSAPPNLRVRPVVFDRDSTAFPGLPAMLHLSAYYEAAKGGAQGYSFAMYPTSIIRYAQGVVPGMGGGAEWHPERFSADAELDLYDCFLVRSKEDRSRRLFGERLEDVTLAFHEGGWWAYEAHPALGAVDSQGRLRSANLTEVRP